MLLATKHELPPLPAAVISRSALNEHLNDWHRYRLLLIQAPAGYGKTYLVRSWLDHAFAVKSIAPNQVAWLSLDGDDGDPMRFMKYFTVALAPIAPEAARRAQIVLAGDRPYPRRAMAAILNELHADDRSVLLVLDDYHRLSSHEVDQLILMALEHGPIRLHLAIISRHVLPMSLGRLAATGRVLNVVANDLRFTRSETAEFLSRLGAPPLTDGELDTLVAKTEGWITGVQLAAISLSAGEDARSFVADVRGDAGWIAPYLEDEVLDKQVPAITEFLLRTSILDRFNGSLAVRVTGRSEAGCILQHVADANLFLVALDAHREWFRYHTLFQEFLQRCLVRDYSAEAVRTLHADSAHWLAADGQITAAVRHYLATGDDRAAIQLLERHVRPAYVGDDLQAAEQRLHSLPEQLLYRSPRLLLDTGWLNCLHKRVNTADIAAHARRVVEQLPRTSQEWQRYNSELLVLEAAAAFLANRFRSAQLSLRAALDQRRYLDDWSTAVLDFLRFHAHKQSGEVELAMDVSKDALRTYERLGFMTGVIAVLCEQAHLIAQRGEPAESLIHFLRALAVAEVDEERRADELSTIYVELAYLYYWIDHMDDACQFAYKAASLAKNLSNRMREVQAHIIMELCDNALGVESGTILYESRELLQLLAESTPREQYSVIRNQIRSGQITLAWSGSRLLGVTVDSDPATHPAGRIAAWLLISVAYGRDLPALEPLLLSARALLRKRGDLFHLTQITALHAWSYLQQEKFDAAGDCILEALDLVERTGYIRIVLDLPALAPLLKDVRHPLAIRLSARFDVVAKPDYGLTDQELVVLQLLADGYKYREIADQLVLSLSTIKSHLQHAYRKLGVNRRLDAVETARSAGLVD